VESQKRERDWLDYLSSWWHGNHVEHIYIVVRLSGCAGSGSHFDRCGEQDLMMALK
jgi:hypothetical protein